MPRSLLFHDAPDVAAAPRFAIGANGFRPFFLLAAAFAVLAVPLWLVILAGRVEPGEYLMPPYWHAHEMVFGFAVAVIAGFLLTAVGNWTQRETATGAPLVALAVLWTAGRVAMLVAARLPHGLPAAVDVSFLPALMIVLARPLIAAKNAKNAVMLLVLAALALANLAVHLDALGVAPGW